jgi:hypothetical protein
MKFVTTAVFALTALSILSVPNFAKDAPRGLSAHDGIAIPGSEQLFAVTITAQDLAAAKIAPGGWWNDDPEFDGIMDPTAEPGSLSLVISAVFGKPDNDPSEVRTAVTPYTNTPASRRAFEHMAATDMKYYGATIAGPLVGERSRYMELKATKDADPSRSLRVQYGRYIARIDATGASAAISTQNLASLGRQVVERLKALDAGKLAIPPLPELARALPAPEMFSVSMGSAVQDRDSFAWVWTKKHGGRLVISPKLRAVLLADPAAGKAVMRRYTVGGAPGNIVEVVVMPFVDAGGAARYFKASFAENLKATPRSDDSQIVLTQPDSDFQAYQAAFRAGRSAVEVTCWAPYGQISPACKAAVQHLANQVRDNLSRR